MIQLKYDNNSCAPTTGCPAGSANKNNSCVNPETGAVVALPNSGYSATGAQQGSCPANTVLSGNYCINPQTGQPVSVPTYGVPGSYGQSPYGQSPYGYPSNSYPSGQYPYGYNSGYNNGYSTGATQCPTAGYVTTSYGCLPQSGCPTGYGNYYGQCLR